MKFAYFLSILMVLCSFIGGTSVAQSKNGYDGPWETVNAPNPNGKYPMTLLGIDSTSVRIQLATAREACKNVSTQKVTSGTIIGMHLHAEGPNSCSYDQYIGWTCLFVCDIQVQPN